MLHAKSQRAHVLVLLLCCQMSRLLHAWKSHETGPPPDSAASLSNMHLNVCKRMHGSQVSAGLCYYCCETGMGAQMFMQNLNILITLSKDSLVMFQAS
jgi:hypothetical protein